MLAGRGKHLHDVNILWDTGMAKVTGAKGKNPLRAHFDFAASHDEVLSDFKATEGLMPYLMDKVKATSAEEYILARTGDRADPNGIGDPDYAYNWIAEDWQGLRQRDIHELDRHLKVKSRLGRGLRFTRATAYRSFERPKGQPSTGRDEAATIGMWHDLAGNVSDTWDPRRGSQGIAAWEPGSEAFLSRKIKAKGFRFPGPQALRRSGGGIQKPRSKDGTYVVGEQGRELFVPEQSGWIIPNHLMHLLPKWGHRAGGGATAAPKKAGPRFQLPKGTPWGQGGRALTPADAHQVTLQAAGSILAAGSSIQKVFVTNWPPVMASGAASGGAAAPTTASSPPGSLDIVALGKEFSKAITDLRSTISGSGTRSTRTSTAKEAKEEKEKEEKLTSPKTGRDVAGRTRARLSSLEAVTGYEQQLLETRGHISEKLQESPVRALSVSIGQMAQQLIGGRAEIQARARTAGASAQDAERRVSLLRGLQDQRDTEKVNKQIILGQMETLRGKGASDEHPLMVAAAEKVSAIDETVASTEEAISHLDPIVKRSLAAADVQARGEKGALKNAKGDDERQQLAKEEAARIRAEGGTTHGIMTRRQQFATQAVGAVGTIGGTMLFSAGMMLTQKAMDELGVAVSAAADRLTGFAGTAAKVTADLSDAARQQGGNVQGAVSGAAGQAGLAYGTDLTGLNAYTARLVGAKNMQDQVGMIRAARYENGGEGGKAGAVRGLGIGFGNGLAPGIPFLETIGQTPGIAEQYGGLLANTMPKPPPGGGPLQMQMGLDASIAGMIGGPGAARTVQNIPAILGDMDQQLLGTIGDIFGNGDLKAGRDRSRANLDALMNPVPTLTPETEGVIKDFSSTLKKVGPQFAKAGMQFTLDTALLDQSGAAMKEAGVSDAVIQEYKDAGIALKSVTGDIVKNGAEVNQVLAANVQGKAVQTPEFVIDSMRRSMIVATNDLNRRAEYSRSTEIPINYATQYMQAPLPNSTLGPNGFTKPGAQVSGLLPQGNLGGFLTGVPQADIASYQKYRGELTGTRKDLNAIYQEGRNTLLEKGVKPEAITSVEKLGSEIRKLSDHEADLTTAYDTQQYNRQLFISKRTLGDIVGLSGQQSVNTADGVVAATKIGQLQRVQLMASRESARISLARSQREIQFAIALARLNTPGATPEEQATKREQAMYLAQENRRQLKLQKTNTFAGFNEQDLSFVRQLHDAAYAIKDAVTGHNITIEIKNIEALKQAKQELMGVKAAVLQSYTTVATETDKLYITAQGDIERQTGVYAKTFNAEVDARLGDLKTKYGTLLALVGIDGGGTGKSNGNGVMNQGPNGPGAGGGLNGGNVAVGTFSVASDKTSVKSDSVVVYNTGPDTTLPGHARGFVADTRGASSMTVGEAGTEHVVVLRNPRRTSLPDPSGGGGGYGPMNMTVNFNGPMQVRDESDIDAIVSKVERALDRRAASMGLVGRQN